MKLYSKLIHFHSWKCIWKIISKMAAILFLPQCVKKKQKKTETVTVLMHSTNFGAHSMFMVYYHDCTNWPFCLTEYVSISRSSAMKYSVMESVPSNNQNVTGVSFIKSYATSAVSFWRKNISYVKYVILILMQFLCEWIGIMTNFGLSLCFSI